MCVKQQVIKFWWWSRCGCRNFKRNLYHWG